MNEPQVKDLEEMANKIVEYVWAVEPDDEEVKLDLLMLASKFVLSSFAKRGEVSCQTSGIELATRCAMVAHMCISGGEEQ